MRYAVPPEFMCPLIAVRLCLDYRFDHLLQKMKEQSHLFGHWKLTLKETFERLRMFSNVLIRNDLVSLNFYIVMEDMENQGLSSGIFKGVWVIFTDFEAACRCAHHTENGTVWNVVPETDPTKTSYPIMDVSLIYEPEDQCAPRFLVMDHMLKVVRQEKVIESPDWEEQCDAFMWSDD